MSPTPIRVTDMEHGTSIQAFGHIDDIRDQGPHRTLITSVSTPQEGSAFLNPTIIEPNIVFNSAQFPSGVMHQAASEQGPVAVPVLGSEHPILPDAIEVFGENQRLGITEEDVVAARAKFVIE